MTIQRGQAEAIQFDGADIRERITDNTERKGICYTIQGADRREMIDDSTKMKGRGYTIRRASRRERIRQRLYNSVDGHK